MDLKVMKRIRSQLYRYHQFSILFRSSRAWQEILEIFQLDFDRRKRDERKRAMKNLASL